MSFSDVLNEYRVRYDTEGRYCRPGWIQFQCPYCLGGRDPNKLYCGYNLSFNYVNCWRCGPHQVEKTLSLLTGMQWRDAKALVEEFDVRYTREVERTGTLLLPDSIGGLKRAHKRYIRSRNFDFTIEELKKLWRVRGIGIASRLQWRLFIPFYFRGEVVSWTTRIIADIEPRYISAGLDEQAIDHKNLLYGEDYCNNSIIVHEGPLDVWATGPGATATCGSQVTPSQILRMSKYAKRIICFDNEPEAQERARKLCDELEIFPGETINVVLEYGKDSASTTPKERRRLRRLAA